MRSPTALIALSETPERCSTTAAAMTASGIVTRLISAARQSNSIRPSTSAIRRKPMRTAIDTLPIEASMNEASRNIVVSIWMPGRPGCIAASAASTFRVTSSVLTSGNFSRTRTRPFPSPTMPSPISGW
jgi:hypothetical protein